MRHPNSTIVLLKGKAISATKRCANTTNTDPGDLLTHLAYKWTSRDHIHNAFLFGMNIKQIRFTTQHIVVSLPSIEKGIPPKDRTPSLRYAAILSVFCRVTRT
ncbi:hypothetical protein AVEN_193209-1 [Araneus ventricosus]|uniref:Uncharacterized protein n=1 Tax=Araneus ventricosus TaxID=182803 RepID=A0A4Y2B3A1_ARAVE|nr:hypothetical protein AVEN_193209-1 [Araneus ventricosus]